MPAVPGCLALARLRLPRPEDRRGRRGGELARISLAIKVATIALDDTPVLVFDEVDSGIGGAVAEIVGRKLRQLGQRRQVLCVTHLPQVAACAHHQYRVSKLKSEDRTESQVEALDDAHDYYGTTWGQGELRAFVLTDKPIYRPGERVRFQAWLRRRDGLGALVERPPQSVAIAIKSSWGDADDFVGQNFAVDAGGIVAGEIKLPDNAADELYGWSIAAGEDEIESTSTFLISRGEPLTLAVDIADPPAQLRPDSEVELAISAAYFSAGAAAGLGSAALTDLFHTQVPLRYRTPPEARVSIPDGGLERLAWSAPETRTGAGWSERSDVYSLGVLLYRLLTGKLPTHAGTEVPVPVQRHAPTCAPELDRLVLRMLQPQPDDRPAAAQLERSLLDILEDELGEELVDTAPDSGASLVAASSRSPGSAGRAPSRRAHRPRR